MSVDVRDAAPGDRAAVEPLWTACLRSHAVPAEPAAFERTWGLVLDPAAALGMRVARRGGRVVGFATHAHPPNSWTGGEDGCLDTLFVAPDARGLGIGRALVDDLCALAAERGWRSLAWHVEAGNVAARSLYDRYGAPDGYLRYRMGVPGRPEEEGSGAVDGALTRDPRRDRPVL